MNSEMRVLLPKFLGVAVLLACSSCVTQRSAPQPTILLLDGADQKWAELPSDVRSAFTDRVRVSESSIDAILEDPEEIRGVIGFLVGDLEAFELVEYLSFDSVIVAQAQSPLHLFRRRTSVGSRREHLRFLFDHLASQSTLISWSPPMSMDEVWKAEFQTKQLWKVLDEEHIGNFQPSSWEPKILFKELEVLIRQYAEDLPQPIFVLGERFEQNLFRPIQSFDPPPETTIAGYLRSVSEIIGIDYYTHHGQIIFDPGCYHGEWFVYRVNPEGLNPWYEWIKEQMELELELRHQYYWTNDVIETPANPAVDIFGGAFSGGASDGSFADEPESGESPSESFDEDVTGDPFGQGTGMSVPMKAGKQIQTEGYFGDQENQVLEYEPYRSDRYHYIFSSYGVRSGQLLFQPEGYIHIHMSFTNVEQLKQLLYLMHTQEPDQ